MGGRESPWMWTLVEWNEFLSQKLTNGGGCGPLCVGLPPMHRHAQNLESILKVLVVCWSLMKAAVFPKEGY